MVWFQKNEDGNVCRLLPDAESEYLVRYHHFRSFLDHHRIALSHMADLDRTYYGSQPFTMQMVAHKCNDLFSEVESMVQILSMLSTEQYEYLSAIFRSLYRSVKDELHFASPTSTDPLTLEISQIGAVQSRIVGAKAANLARIQRELALTVPTGFAITTSAFHFFLQENGLLDKIDNALRHLAADDPASIESVGKKIQALIIESPLPAKILKAMEAATSTLSSDTAGNIHLAVRSSAIGEDGEISFAGQYTSVLNVPIEKLSEAYKQVLASKYSASALSYRLHHGLDEHETPMAVLVLKMVQPLFSGVLYSADPVGEDRQSIRISAVHGLGDTLVAGNISPQRTYRIKKSTFNVLETGGTDTSAPFPSETLFLRELWESAKVLEDSFQRPLDIEWALDHDHRLFILQVRPLIIADGTHEREYGTATEYADHPLLIEGGKCAAGGVVSGRVLVMTNTEAEGGLLNPYPDTILVARTASTSITPWMSKIRGIITDTGSVASHLASVAREFSVPALFDTETATTILADGQEITLWASQMRVYDGVVEELAKGMRPVKRPIFASPIHLRLQRLLDLISPLNLPEPDFPQFTQEECRTVHDIICYCNEMVIREMFHFRESVEHLQGAVHLRTSIPIDLHALNLGNGLRQGLTTCDDLNVHDVVSRPFRALWRGLSHPRLNWTKTITTSARNFIPRIVSQAIPQKNPQGGASYVLVSADYMNLGTRFNYHSVTVDTLCGTDPAYNYINLQFSGGADAYYSRCLRIQYMAAVLDRLGFETSTKGDFIEASLTRLDQNRMEESLEKLGYLLGTSQMLDLTQNTLEQVAALADSFFQDDDKLLNSQNENAPKGFYLITGNWKTAELNLETGILQNGSAFGSRISTGVSQAMTNLMGKRYQEMLDNIGAYYYFPLVAAMDSKMNDGRARVRVKPLSGVIDQAGGLAFAIRDWDNYFVFRINALEDNAILFEFKNGRRIERASTCTPIAGNQWHKLQVEISGHRVLAFLEDHPILEYSGSTNLYGYVGLWTKADSVTFFNEFVQERPDTMPQIFHITS
ncbi:PEP/pyruvate-binding domain-containing protein [Desulfobotulus mexicanus]|uniref:Phosphoenolpyruvate synthase n=1 Tax=Desulfobotulus mexicanus TaxID=2586642 RepID=A0A5Q4VG05_9BACT|nr:PEP/pyruvate-binding domain-containing protein [Desulfobotulus mexicanus]TYT75202.1 hypothetical protein FIM25_05705 [Desulfobotulus mexicanus]